MKKFELLAASALATIAMPAAAQTQPVDTPAATADQAADRAGSSGIEDIVITAQRRSETLQAVPIAVSAFTAEALDKQQIENPSDLQLTLPNVTFTKGNFTGSSFTIRGIGDLCVGVSCDSATAIHLNGTPLLATRLFETEFFDLERIEVLRGPQGTLFGRNATSGVVNFLTAKPDLSGFHVSGEGEYGNFDAYRFKGMVNVPLGETLGFRGAGFYQKRDGFTKNLFNNTRIDGRDMYAVRGSLRWEPSVDTTVDLMGYYFREKDDRLRIQKQLCQRDPTGVLGCLPGRLDNNVTNANSQFSSTLTSREFLTVNGIPSAFGLGSLYGPDAYAAANANNPRSLREVRTDNVPTYFTDEQQYQARIEHNFGSVKAQLTGFYHKTRVDASQDYNLSVADRSIYASGLATLSAAAAGQVPGLPAAYFTPITSAILPNGPTGQLCTSQAEETGTGAYGGFKNCAATPLDYDRSNQKTRDFSVEGILTTDFDGPFNALVGGIYVDAKVSENSYYVNGFSIDYLSGVLGSFNSLGRAALGFRPSYLGTPFFRNQTGDLRVKSYGIFGEAYYEVNDAIKLTVGVRYNNDKKAVVARSTLASFPVPYGSASAFSSPYVLGFNFAGAPATAAIAPFDADLATPCVTTPSATGVVSASTGCELDQSRKATFDDFTGRAVIDVKLTDDSLLYFSYSRGYKSGGINPPLQPIFAVPDSFVSENVDAFEVGSKNTFLDGTLRLNLTAFYYKYKNLQLSRIVARTAVNDNVNANIYGFEAEAIVAPTREFQVNLGFSYLKTKVSEDKLLSNPRDFSGGRADAVIIKDITNASNCAVIPTVAGNAVGVNTYVGAVNGGLGLRAPTAFPADGGISATGAFGICSVLASTAAAPPAPLRALFATPTGALPFTVLTAGVPVNIRGNALPQAPIVKFSAGAQYTIEFDGGMSLVPRADLTYTGDSYGNIFNGNVNRVRGYEQVNAQLQLNGSDDRWYVRGFIQNVTANNAITGLAVGDQSSGLFTNVFSLDPRRYGIGAGFKF